VVVIYFFYTNFQRPYSESFAALARELNHQTPTVRFESIDLHFLPFFLVQSFAHSKGLFWWILRRL
jgi:hypothetical protein